jgi:predicted dehydrogenase
MLGLNVPAVHAAENNTIKIALIGCGGRGGGAVRNCLKAGGPIQLHALADIFPNKVEGYAKALAQQFKEFGTVPQERQFSGFDSYKKAISSLDPGKDLVLLCTPPAFRPTHVEYAVNHGVNVFMEKSFATDAPGLRKIEAASKLADEKGLKLACGLMWRHSPAHEETIKRIHDGMIGDIMYMRTYRFEHAVPAQKRNESDNELEYQIRNYHNFTWTNGGLFMDWCIHNVDILCWAKQDWPEGAIGMGGRTTPDVAGQVFDHQHVEYFFKDGKSLYAFARHMNGTPCFYTDHIVGTKGRAEILDGFRIFKGTSLSADNKPVWQFDGKKGYGAAYDIEHRLLVDAIRNNKPYNEGHRAVQACLAGIMGRMAYESGQHIHASDAHGSTMELFPGIENCTRDTQPPVLPDKDGHYPYAIPGKTKV